MDDTNLFGKLTLGVVQSLEKRHGVCDVKLTQRLGESKQAISLWEQKTSCMMPADLKNFYLTTSGLLLRWSVKMNETHMPVGHMEIVTLDRLLRIGGHNVKVTSGNMQTPPILVDTDMDSDDESVDNPKPRFDHRSRIFELDPCQGYSKVCLVYKNTKPGIPASDAEYWLLDRSLSWHYMTSSFTAFFRQMLLHLGLPHWHLVYTDIGLPPQAMQWFHMFAPKRMHMDDRDLNLETGDSTKASTCSLDVAKVFKGKADKKKLSSAQNANKKKIPMVSSAKSLPTTSSQKMLSGTSQVTKLK